MIVTDSQCGHPTFECPTGIFLHVKFFSEVGVLIFLCSVMQCHIQLEQGSLNTFLSDPGKPGVRSLGPDVTHKQTEVCKT